MKTAIPKFCFYIGLVFISLFSNCKKEIVPQISSNIDLSDKPLSVIKSHIVGKWFVNYAKGGLCSTCIFDRKQYEEYYEFSANDRVKYTFKGNILADANLTWRSYKPSGYSNDIFVMEFIDNRLYPNFFQVDKIYNDTLILCSPDKYNPDYQSYYLTRSN